MSTVSPAVLSVRKEAAASFLRMVAGGRIREAYDTYLAPDFRHHNVFFAGDRASLLRGMEENAAKNPGMTLEVKRVIGEGDYVAVHSHVRLNPGEPGLMLAHIFRFEGDGVVEAWDIGQAIPKVSPNQLGPF